MYAAGRSVAPAPIRRGGIYTVRAPKYTFTGVYDPLRKDASPTHNPPWRYVRRATAAAFSRKRYAYVPARSYVILSVIEMLTVKKIKF